MLSFKSKDPNFAGMLQAIQAIRELHRKIPYKSMDGTPYPECAYCIESYPCETIKILDKYDIL